MGKKIWHSQPLSEMWEQYKKFYRQTHKTTDDFFAEKKCQIIYALNQPLEDVRTHMIILDLWRLDTNKKFMHVYFKTKELRDFLAEMRLADLDGIKDFLFESGENFNSFPNFYGKNIGDLGKVENVQAYSFGLYIPYEKAEKGYAFQLALNEKRELVLFWAIGKNEGYCSARNYNNNLHSTAEHSEFYTKTFRLAVNTIAYMKAFPECVTEGVPKNENDEYGCTLDISEKIVESVKNTNSNRMVAPHFRKGFWKVLRSDYFTHKKGQIIFVSETMVNGVAKTVEKSTDKEKLDDFSK